MREIEALARRARIAITDTSASATAADRHGVTRRETEVLRLLADGLSCT
jgi:DNA-binding CsgD family transcriptional regulator